MALIGTMTILPFVATFFGAGVAPTPNVNSTQDTRCSVGQKDKYGRCPFSGSSGFRAFSAGAIGGTGGFGGSK